MYKMVFFPQPTGYTEVNWEHRENKKGPVCCLCGQDWKRSEPDLWPSASGSLLCFMFWLFWIISWQIIYLFYLFILFISHLSGRVRTTLGGCFDCIPALSRGLDLMALSAPSNFSFQVLSVSGLWAAFLTGPSASWKVRGLKVWNTGLWLNTKLKRDVILEKM